MPVSVVLGRVVRDGEPLWLDDDRDAAIALLEEESDECSGCGQPRSASMSATADGAYEVQMLRCHACAAKARAVGKFMSSGGSGDGLMVVVTKKEG